MNDKHFGIGFIIYGELETSMHFDLKNNLDNKYLFHLDINAHAHRINNNCNLKKLNNKIIFIFYKQSLFIFNMRLRYTSNFKRQFGVSSMSTTKLPTLIGIAKHYLYSYNESKYKTIKES